MNLNEIKNTLRLSIEELNIRNLKISSKWLLEHLIGIKNNEINQLKDNLILLNSNEILIELNEKDLIYFSNILISSSEYQRCANLLKQKYENELINSNISLFLLVYSLYLAGEKIKDQNLAESSG